MTVSGSNGGMVTFTAKLDPSQTYQFCELHLPAGWNTTITSLTGWFYLNVNSSLINDTPCVPIGAGTPYMLRPGQFLTIGSTTGTVAAGVPTGITFNTTTGVLSGVTSKGTYHITFTATNLSGMVTQTLR